MSVKVVLLLLGLFSCAQSLDTTPKITSKVVEPNALPSPAFWATAAGWRGAVGASPATTLTSVHSPFLTFWRGGERAAFLSVTARQAPALAASDESQTAAAAASETTWIPIFIVCLVAFCCVFCFAVLGCAHRHKPDSSATLSDPAAVESSVDPESAPEKHASTATTTAQVSPQLDGVFLERKIGSGAFGAVFIGSWNGSKVSMKEVNEQDIEKEAKLMSTFNHLNIVHFLGIAKPKVGSDSTASPDKYYLVFEYAEYGDVLSWMSSGTRLIFPADKVRILKEAASGMAYLASQGIVHRDLAARNVLIDSALKAKISDFGLSRDKVQEVDESSVTSTISVPVRWSPVEVLQQRSASEKSDVFSFGILCWEVCSGGLQPFLGMDNAEVAQTIAEGRDAIMKKLKKPSGTPDGVYEAASECWHLLPADRPTFETLVAQFEELQAGTQSRPKLSAYSKSPSTLVEGGTMRGNAEYAHTPSGTLRGNDFGTMRGNAEYSHTPVMTNYATPGAERSPSPEYPSPEYPSPDSPSPKYPAEYAYSPSCLGTPAMRRVVDSELAEHKIAIRESLDAEIEECA